VFLLLLAATITDVMAPIGLTYKKKYAGQIYVDHLGKINAAEA
jgi:hypothetical protein